MNKHNILIFLIGFVLAVGIFFAYQFGRNQHSNLPNKSNKALEIQEKSLKTYVNDRFEYSIMYPSNWPIGKESDNGDGISLYRDNEANEILVYASNVPYDFSTQKNILNQEVISLDDGEKATALKLRDVDGKLGYYVFIDAENKQYIFFAKVTDQFFKENEEILTKTAKTLKISSL